MRVGYYQNNPEFGNVSDNLDRIAAAIETAEADVLVLPELCASGYQFVSMDEVRTLAEPVPAGPTTTRLPLRSTSSFALSGDSLRTR